MSKNERVKLLKSSSDHDADHDIREPESTIEYDDDIEDVDESIREFDISAIPNDFNVKTIVDFIQSGSVKIPGFQRNYVWDIRRASKLIESIVIGLPIPQIFLYEDHKNNFLVIDGQQRLMSLYFFVKGRFPRMERRAEIRALSLETGIMSDEVLEDDRLFRPFQLQLPSREPNDRNPLNSLRYTTLGQNKVPFDLRTIRNVIIKQNKPSDDDSSIYEIFNRLNSGGVNLKPQEIRVALYHSPFYVMLSAMNLDSKWRKVLGVASPDLHLKDMEILLRSFAMLCRGEEYKPSLVKFINRFSREAKSISSADVELYRQIGDRFLSMAAADKNRLFYNKKTNRFNVPMFEAVFAAACKLALSKKDSSLVSYSSEWIHVLRTDDEFLEATQLHTTGTPKVQSRLRRAAKLLREHRST